MSRKATASAITVPLTDSSEALASITATLLRLRAEADDEGHDGGEAPLGLRLGGGALDGGVASQPVTDGGADGAPAEGETGGDQRPGPDDRGSGDGGRQQ